jgi:MYXO-CTERM domain-containing protein
LYHRGLHEASKPVYVKQVNQLLLLLLLLGLLLLHARQRLCRPLLWHHFLHKSTSAEKLSS